MWWESEEKAGNKPCTSSISPANRISSCNSMKKIRLLWQLLLRSKKLNMTTILSTEQEEAIGRTFANDGFRISAKKKNRKEKRDAENSCIETGCLID